MEIEDVIRNKDDREFVIKAVQENDKFLEFVSPVFQNDREIVNLALDQDAESLEFASDKLKEDKEII